jgi:hypothetical protein
MLDFLQKKLNGWHLIGATFILKVPEIFLKADIKRSDANSAIVWFWVLFIFTVLWMILGYFRAERIQLRPKWIFYLACFASFYVLFMGIEAPGAPILALYCIIICWVLVLKNAKREPILNPINNNFSTTSDEKTKSKPEEQKLRTNTGYLDIIMPEKPNEKKEELPIQKIVESKPAESKPRISNTKPNFCGDCGASLAPAKNFCANCGKKTLI